MFKRIGYGNYFIQVSIDKGYSWDYLIRIGNKGLAFNKFVGLKVRDYKLE